MTWNQFKHFHKQAEVIGAWRKLFGPVLRWLTPTRRRLLLGLAACVIVIDRPLQSMAKVSRRLDSSPDLIGSALLVITLFGFVWLCYLGAKRFSSLPGWVRRHPQISLHAIFWLLLVVIWTAPLENRTLKTVLFGCVFVLPFLLWRIGYMLFTAQRGKMAQTRFIDHLAYIYPVWGGTDTPYGKGWDYLSANEAKDEEGLAKSQLAGVKLFLLAALWAVSRDLLDALVFGDQNTFSRLFGGWSFGITNVKEMFAGPEDYPRAICWAALYFEFVRSVLGLAAKGHVIVGCLRLAGFNVFRNTYKPLLAETVVEFWNRYYYYFKELLVNFFFYPTFTRYFKSSPRLRIVAAVFMAAMVGNVYYHWLGLEGALVNADFAKMWTALQSRVFYCALLAAGISISMLREQKRVKTSAVRSWPRRVAAIFGVWTFFTIIHIWTLKAPEPFAPRFKFFLNLIGLG